MATLAQDDFGAGIYRGRKAPGGSVYDALNALLDEEGQLFERGKSALYSASNASEDLLWLSTRFMTAPGTNRILAGGASSLNVLDAGLAPVALYIRAAKSRVAGAGDLAVLLVADGPMSMAWYGGSLKAGIYSTGTITVNPGDLTVTGSGTSWLTNVDAGMMFQNAAFPVVKSVDSDTQITLMKPWSDIAQSGFAYNLYPFFTTGVGLPVPFPPVARAYLGSAAQRVLIAVGNRVYFSAPGTPDGFDENAYHELAAGDLIIGVEGQGDSALVFTTRGIWRISNLSLDPVDDAGNVQHIVEQVNKDVVLWDDYGIAAWDTSIIVPAVEDVYLISPDFGLRVLSEGIRPLYRAYVKAGYQPGLASVHRGHYFLPIMNGATLVDVLVCRLDRPYPTQSGRILYPWTRWAGHAASPSYAILVSETTRAPKLLGLAARRVTDLSACMEATGGVATQDADSTTPTFTVILNDLPMGSGRNRGTAEKAITVYETTGGTPTITLSTATGPEGSSYTNATLKRGGGASTGTDYSAWKISRSADRIRVKFTTSSQVTSLILRSVELVFRPMIR